MNPKELINGISRVMDTINKNSPSYKILEEAQNIIKESSVSDEFIMESFEPVIEKYHYREYLNDDDNTLTCEYLFDVPDGYMYKITKRFEVYGSFKTFVVKLSRRPTNSTDVVKIWDSVRCKK